MGAWGSGRVRNDGVKPGVAARVKAAELVGRIDRAGAWSNVLAGEVTGDDAALVRHLMYGTTRYRCRIDRAIDSLADRPTGSIDSGVLDTLRVAFYEVLFGRSPDHAVADSAVEAVRQAGSAGASGFVNALVRRLQRGGEPERPSDLASSHCMPGWLIHDLEGRWQRHDVQRFVEASDEEPPIGIRARKRGARPDAGHETGVAGAWYVDSEVPDGYIVQDPASVAVVNALAPEPGESVLEIGAAPGGKTLAIGDAGARTVAVDAHKRRVRTGKKRTEAHGFNGSWVGADGRQLPFRPGTFDRVLLDAPCTGLGTLRRRPEIRYKATPAERDRLAALQAELLDAALEAVRPGGRVVYSVCTVTAEETLGVVELRGGRTPSGIIGEDQGSGVLLAPHTTGTDGMFISVFVR